ncbi:DMT family transporter [Actinospica sp.]|jgi:drug/metabolite transporter (DMT)-like permease|uniref:DMT family transporter n=1 Tax=Actinospica sp. TaxID=1872142 RepID=UPI002CB8572D|nr:DMT family transporter [Actinospica sp.]HWG26658.1 DMT family transporter [Actinospica sp.]
MNALSVVTALLSALSNGASLVLQRRASVGLKPVAGRGPRVILARLAQPLARVTWWGGAAATILSAAFQVIALDSGQLSVVQPLLASELLFTLLLGSIVFHRRPSRALWMAFVMLAGGLAIFLIAASPSGGTGHAHGVRWLAVGVALSSTVAVLVLVALRVHGTVRAAVLGAATAVCFSATAALIKEVTRRFPGGAQAVLTTWHTYAAAIVGVLSVLLLQWTLRAGSLAGSQPALTLGDAMLSVALGVVLFGESIDLGWHVVIELAGIGLMAFGVLGLAGAHVIAPDSATLDEAEPARGG